MTDIIPRGIRANNALNIRHGKDHWHGLAKEQVDPDFVTFDSPVMGLRAALKIIKNYKLHTVWEIISRWAPPVENDTNSYADHVAHNIGVGIHDEIDLNSEYTMIKMIQAMVIHENGSPKSHPNWLRQNEPFWYNKAVYEAAWAALKS